MNDSNQNTSQMDYVRGFQNMRESGRSSSQMVYVRGFQNLPETVQSACLGHKLSTIVESRYLRSKHAREARIVSVAVGEHGAAIYLDRYICRPTIETRKTKMKDPVFLV